MENLNHGGGYIRTISKEEEKAQKAYLKAAAKESSRKQAMLAGKIKKNNKTGLIR